MQNARVALAALLDLTARVDHGEGRAVADGHAVEEANAFGEELEDVGQGQVAHEHVVALYDDGVAVGLQGGYDILVGEEDALGYARRAGGVHDDGRVLAVGRDRLGPRRPAHADNLLEGQQPHALLRGKKGKRGMKARDESEGPRQTMRTL
jgi:hypothetical protein